MSKSKSMSKLHVAFTFNNVSYYVNADSTYFAKKAESDTRITRISRSAFETAQGAFAFETECRAESAQTESDPAPVVESVTAESVTDPTPATVDATPAPIEAAPAPVDPAPVMDGATRPDWAAMQSFERVTLEDVQAVPALVARGLGFAAMGLCKVAAMGIGAMVGLGLMGLKRAVAR